MAVLTPERELADIERGALEHLDDPGRTSGAGPLDDPQPEEVVVDESPLRHTLAVLAPVIGAGALAGGIFSAAVVPRAVAILAGGGGCALAYGLRRTRSVTVVMVGFAGGLLVIGILGGVLVGGPGVVGNVPTLIRDALHEARLVRPPIDMTAGFGTLVALIMGGAGFCATWTAIVVRKPSIGLLLPLPVAAVVAISLPDDAKLASGLVLLVLFGIGLGILSGDRAGTGTNRLPLRFELIRTVRGLPLVAAVCIGLVFLGKTGFLFPTPVISPQLQAQKPNTVPIQDVPDRVLFTVLSTVTGPWVVGVLDVYDGSDWRLPPFDEARLTDVSSSGVVDGSLPAGVAATFTVRNLSGAVLPVLPNTVGVEATGPRLAYDSRSGNLRLVEGQIPDGFVYKVAAAATPMVADVAADNGSAPSDIQARFTDIPPAPPAVTALLAQAPTTSKWAEFDYLRTYILKNVTATGAGTPVSVTPERVQEILGSATKEASPFEIVAIQAMLGRWMGLPSRIAYGFDGGQKNGDVLEVHPRNGASFPEVYFPRHGWLPVIGTPAHAKESASSDPQYQQVQQGVTPSEDVAVPLYLPIETPGTSALYEQVRNIAIAVGVVLLALALAYLLVPVVRKAVVRARRRAAARRAGPRARVVEAYAEWRDTLADFGYEHPSDTPIMLLQRFAPDAEHAQLAWLVTRALWGDLHDDVTDVVAADAEELAGTLRRRLAQAHQLTVRLVAGLSRRSLRTGYAITLSPQRDPRATPEETARVA